MKIFEGSEAIVVDKSAGEPRILLLQTQKGVWQFSSGGIESGETPKQCLVREVKEETGIDASQIKKIQQLPKNDEFQMGDTLCRFYPFVVETNEKPTVDIENNPDEKEHQDFKWVSSDEAERLLKYPNQKAVLEEVKRYLSGAL